MIWWNIALAQKASMMDVNPTTIHVIAHPHKQRFWFILRLTNYWGSEIFSIFILVWIQTKKLIIIFSVSSHQLSRIECKSIYYEIELLSFTVRLMCVVHYSVQQCFYFNVCKILSDLSLDNIKSILKPINAVKGQNIRMIMRNTKINLTYRMIR